MNKVTDRTFDNFSDFWSCTKRLDDKQRGIIFENLSRQEQIELNKSYYSGGWEDVFMRNKIDQVVDGINKDFGINLINLRIKVLKGKSFYMKKSQWKFINDILVTYLKRHVNYLLHGLSVENVDENTICIVKK